MASPPPPPSSASHRRRSRPPSPTASSVASSPAFPPRKKRRSGRPPPLLGLACSDGFYPAWDPHRAPNANERFPFAKRTRALARKADFEYHFLKEAWSWSPLDARDGRVLIQSRSSRSTSYAVCDPLFKRYVLLPPIPDRLTASQGRLVNFGLCLAPFREDEVDTSLCLAPSQSQEVDVGTSFRVIRVARYETKLVVLVFSSVTRQWGVATSSDWTSLGTEEPPNSCVLQRFDYVDGCFYWTSLPSADKILVLDALKMELSVINYAHRVEYGVRACIAVDRKGAPGMLTVGEYLGNRQFRLSRIAKRSDHGSPNERLSENVIQLPGYHNEYFTLGAAEGFIFLRGVPEDDQDEGYPYWEPPAVDYYSLNVKTAEFVKVTEMDPGKYYGSVFPYFRFPPPSAKPCV